MCTSPRKFGDVDVACRECDQCLAARRNKWVARAMAERSVAGHTYALGLTYADLPAGGKPAGATVFRYRDIQTWLKLLRSRYKDYYGVDGEIRYIVAGEQGSKGTRRVHWHVILFTDRPVGPVGVLKEFHSGKPLPDIVDDVRIDWDLWPHGHVTFQVPDQRGISYAVKYALKDQWSSAKSKGRSREQSSQLWAASMFRMSKKPPIGWRFVSALLDRYERRGNVPPTLELRVPDYSGYWFLDGQFAEYAASRCHDINKEYRANHGRDCSGWDALLHSVQDARSGLDNRLEDILINGTPEESGPLSEAAVSNDKQQFAIELARRRRASASASERGRIVSKCGRILPCPECAQSWSVDALADFQREENRWFTRWCESYGYAQDDAARQRFRSWWRYRGRASRGCLLRETARVKGAIHRARIDARTERRAVGYAAEDGGRSIKPSGPSPARGRAVEGAAALQKKAGQPRSPKGKRR